MLYSESFCLFQVVIIYKILINKMKMIINDDNYF